jgi:hypothetical protein
MLQGLITTRCAHELVSLSRLDGLYEGALGI